MDKHVTASNKLFHYRSEGPLTESESNLFLRLPRSSNCSKPASLDVTKASSRVSCIPLRANFIVATDEKSIGRKVWYALPDM